MSTESRPVTNNEIYEAAVKQPQTLTRKVLYAAWTLLGLFGLIAVAWAEPWSEVILSSLHTGGVSQTVTDFVLMPLVMTVRAVLLVESFGYLYHRFFQHVGFFTRLALVFRRNQKFHWMHHMWIYPIGRLYKRAMPYVSSEKGFGWSWVLPGVLLSGLFVLSNGFTWASAVFVLAFGLYAKYVIDLTHCRFHMTNHAWVGNRYFQWLEEIHLLHHWDQRTNFTIVHPLMDVLFGTYLSPRTHRKELAIALADIDLTASDLINWRYILIEATPAERAAFVTNSYRHGRSIRKVNQLVGLLTERAVSHPDDRQARVLHARALALAAEIARKSG